MFEPASFSQNTNNWLQLQGRTQWLPDHPLQLKTMTVVHLATDLLLFIFLNQ